jgi:hypothetical protein
MDEKIIATNQPPLFVESLDLTPEVFEKLAPTNTGVIDISWCVIGENGCTGGGSGKASAS